MNGRVVSRCVLVSQVSVRVRGCVFSSSAALPQDSSAIEPDELANILDFSTLESAFALTQAVPHKLCLKARVFSNMLVMSVTLDTSHCDRLWLNDFA